MEPIDIALIGAGQWGCRYLETLTTMEEVKIRWCCDSNPSIAPVLKNIYPQVRFTTQIDDVFKDVKVAGIVIATPPHTHYFITKMAIAAGKNVLLEKPFALTYSEANELVTLAKSRQLVLMAGHIMEYHPVMAWVRDLMAAKELGRILYLYSQRVNLGGDHHGVNVLWDLAIHDLSIIRYLLNTQPLQISAHGSCHLQPNVYDVVFVTIACPDNIVAQIHVSCINPLKSRMLTVVGDKRTLVFDDANTDKRVHVYNQGISDLSNPGKEPDQQQSLPCGGDRVLAAADYRQPLKTQCRHFSECIRYGKEPVTGAMDILWVTRVAEIAQKSLECQGIPLLYRDTGN